jgi:hypothetical protein
MWFSVYLEGTMSNSINKLPFYLNLVVLVAAIGITITSIVLMASQGLPWDQGLGMAVTGVLLAAISAVILRFDLKNT